MRIPGIAYVQGRNSYADPDGRHYGIAIHNTSNNASDEGEASYATWRPDGTSAHLYVDSDSVIQSLDTDARAGHAGSIQGNDNAIAVEITGGNGMSRDWWLSNVAWDELGRVLAYVITHDPDYAGFEVRRASVAEMRTNPRVKALYGHDDMRQAWGGTTHVDPGPGFPWDRLFECVNAALTGPTAPEAPKPRENTVGEFLVLSDGPVPGGIYYTNYVACRYIASPADVAALIDRGAAKPYASLGRFTVAEAAPIFGPPIESLKGAKGDSGDKGDAGPVVSDEHIAAVADSRIAAATLRPAAG